MYKLEELSISDLNVIKTLASDKVFGLPLDTDKKIIDYWDDVHMACKKEMNIRIAELFPVKP